MRTLFRVDPRLVHATLMNAWVPFLGVTELAIIDDAVASDPRSRTILSMSAMDVPVRFATERDAATVLSEEEKGARIVLFSSLESVERAMDSGLVIEELNIGHLPEAEGRTAVLPAVHLGPSDVRVVEGLEERGVRVYVQPLPRDARLRIKDLEHRPKVASPIAARRHPSKIPERPRPPERALTPGPVGSSRVSARLRVVNDRGLHLRAAHALAHLAATIEETVQVANGPDFVNAKSLLGLTTLGATLGTVLDVVVTGTAPHQAMERIRALFASGFGEGARPGMSVEVDG